MDTFNIANTPKPSIIQELAYNQILNAMRTDLAQRMPELDLSASDPASKILELCAYREQLLRQRINNAAQSVMLAFAQGTDLDAIASLFSLSRKEITKADPNARPPTKAIYESDEEFRKRIQLAPYAITTAGSRDSYKYHALSADPDVKDVYVSSSTGGVVDVAVQSHSNGGIPSTATLNKVILKLNKDSVRPICDTVNVTGASAVTYNLDASLFYYPQADSTATRTLAIKELKERITSKQTLGKDITISAIHAALHQAGVHRVELINPSANITISPTEFAVCTGINIIDGGLDE